MATKQRYLDMVESYSVQDFIDFLYTNNLTEFEQVSRVKGVDGHTFLNLAEFEINSWKPLIDKFQAEKFWTFLNRFQTYPESFHFVRPITPAKPSINKQKLQKLSQNQNFIEDLQKACRNIKGNTQTDVEIPQIQIEREQFQNRSAPIRPAYINPPKELPQHDDSSDDNLYVLPNEHAEIEQIKPAKLPPLSQTPAVRNYRRKISPVIPNDDSEMLSKLTIRNSQRPVPKPPSPSQRLIPEPAESSDDSDDSDDTHKTKPPQKFALLNYYKKDGPKPKKNIPTSPIQHIPLPPLPVRNDSLNDSRPRLKSKSPQRTNSLPRPPKSLPKVDVPQPPRLPKVNVPQPPKLPKPPIRSPILLTPMEQQAYYRYTDRKGAEELLAQEFGNGTYLIRPSRNYYGTLSIREADKVYHIGIKKLEDNTLEVESSGLDLQFDHLEDIIDHFRENALTVRNKLNQIIDIYLRRTLPADRT